ncbi:unnamed protein product [Closterium sp. Yama58-4]|nr:unnamed protein product [Closterium sp. Yama58-4]
MAELEARKLKYPTTGTEALLMGMLTEGECFSCVLGVLTEVVCKCKLKYYTHTGTEALLMGMLTEGECFSCVLGVLTEGTNYGARFLRANGIKLMDLRVKTVELLGKADMYYFSPEHPPLTEPALAALQWAIAKHKELGRAGEISTALILLGIWEQRESAGHKLLAQLGFHDALASQLTADLSAVAA